MIATSTKFLLPLSVTLCSLILAAYMIQYSKIKYRTNYKSVVKSDCQDPTGDESLSASPEMILSKQWPSRVNSDKSFMGKIIYNRVGKCGSRSMLTLMGHLAKMNKFTLYSSRISNDTRPSFINLLREVKDISNMPLNTFYSRHIHFIDFAKYGVQPPVYINMIRDPIERFVSQYYFQRYGDVNKAVGRRASPWHVGERSMDINECILTNHSMCSSNKLYYIVPYFCGQDVTCQRPSFESLERAKRHVIENYLVVGYLEEFESFLMVLEQILPQYFRGSLDTWSKISNLTQKRTSTLHKNSVNSTSYKLLRKKMEIEYDFYNFIRSRFRILKKQFISEKK